MAGTKYDIVYSITAHEKIDLVWQLYENIVRYNEGLSVLVIFHVNKELYDQRKDIPDANNLLFHPTPTDKARFTSSIFFAHLENYRLVHAMDFDYFCTLASNSLFVRKVDKRHLDKNIPALRPTSTGYSLGDPEMWSADEFVKNMDLADIFQENNIAVKIAIHFGAYFRKETMWFINDFCEKKHITPDIFVNDKIAAEEIILPSLEALATGRVSPRYGLWLPTITMNDVEEIMERGGCRGSVDDRYTIVRVGREDGNEMRKMIINQQTENVS